MKVLFLGNTAGAFTPVAEWLHENGHEVKIVVRACFDPYKFTENSGLGVLVDGPLDLYKETMRQIEEMSPDIVHISSSRELLLVARIQSWKTPIVFTYHGVDARDPTGRPHKIVSQLADHVTVTTPDLSSYGNFLDRPIGHEFHYRGGRVIDTALMFYRDYFYADKRGLAKEWCTERGYELTILDDAENPIPHDEIPEVLSKYEYYLDWKDQRGELHALSKMALEALRCGCKVIHDSDFEREITESNVDWVTPEDYLSLYDEVVKGRSKWRHFRRLPRVLWWLVKWRRGGLDER